MWDSLKVFLKRFRDRSPLVMSGKSTTCAKNKHLRDMAQPATAAPDNKGAAALASFTTLSAYNTLWSSEQSSTAWYESTKVWYKAWFDHTYGHFSTGSYWAGDSPTDNLTWIRSWNGHDASGYGDTINMHINPILGDLANSYSHPNKVYEVSPDIWTWQALSGAPSEDLIRENCNPPGDAIFFHHVPYTASMTIAASPATALLAEEHVGGTINYLVNAAEILHNRGVPSFAFANNGAERMIDFFDTYAGRDDCTNDNPPLCIHCEGAPSTPCTPTCGTCPNDCVVNQWKQLKDQRDDWPATFIVSKRGGTVTTGVASPRREGKQMSFTDLTHQ